MNSSIVRTAGISWDKHGINNEINSWDKHETEKLPLIVLSGKSGRCGGK